MRRLATALVVCAFGAAAGDARADPLPSNDYTIDLFQGPLLAPLRVIGIAGAYAGYAEGIAGFVSNAAAPAVRSPYSYDTVSGDLTGSISVPLDLFDNNDFDDSGDTDYDYSNFIYVTGGAELQVGPVGVGALGELQSYSVTSADSTKTNVLVGKYHVLAAMSVFRGQASIGAGARAVSMGLTARDINLTIAGIAPEIGFLVRPDWLPFRAGATFRFPVEGEPIGDLGKVGADGLRRAGGFVLPRSVVLPWELELGVAFQAGSRPLSPSWIDPSEEKEPVEYRVELARQARAARRERTEKALGEDAAGAYAAPADRVEKAIEKAEDRYVESEERYMRDQRVARYEAWPRDKLLVTLSLLVTGPVADGVSVERFLAQGVAGEDRGHVIGSSGASVSFSPRLGLEAEPIANVLATRVGTYYEPNRFGDVGRQHFTFGGDIRLFSTTFWGLIPKITYSLASAVDLSPRYQSASIALGVWH